MRLVTSNRARNANRIPLLALAG
ncbi:hypothetical protein DSM3645_19488 [Blastopirellula marina DSM 3645]|uniref:Uncharacterized protein n=1 Tax=Blastopirellula marina DSM 3645 TaxID=314230 RepID=A3ZTF3_9BACT|nr:hypothetical protein DSM3645_19488 [Blastopirellula marina DSM 3645]